MINILSYFGMNMQSEVCLWTLLGLLSTIFDATLFKVNANLKQVWQMRMPAELSMPVQRALRTMISGVMLVQCFTVYVYLATYIVLLYPVFLEERPTLVLPWLLLAAIRKLLCELLSLALGLATCLLVGPARPPCIKFVVIKIISIMPSFYMWMLVLSYYHALKVASSFKTFRATLPSNDLDYGLELAIRRRRTKSLFGEALVRSRLISNLYSDKQINITENLATSKQNDNLGSHTTFNEKSDIENKQNKIDKERMDKRDEQVAIDSKVSEVVQALSTPNRLPSDIGTYEDWFGNEIIVPRNTDRINEQFGLMLLRIGAYFRREKNCIYQIFESPSILAVPEPQEKNLNCPTLTDEATETPPLVASNKGNIASYLRDYPDIFMKKNDSQLQQKLDSIRIVQSQIEGKSTERANNELRQITRINSGGNITVDVERALTQKTKSGARQIDSRHQKRIEADQLKHFEDTKYKAAKNIASEEAYLEHQNSAEASEQDESATPISSSNSLTSTLDKMKTSLLRAKSSKKRKEKNVKSSQIISSSTSSGENSNDV